MASSGKSRPSEGVILISVETGSKANNSQNNFSVVLINPSKTKGANNTTKGSSKKEYE
ncbi:hypothetical protein KACHI17_15950 [Sediminibacterium sp. KACHI17]|uniref:Uncharacterized protein n=1 Tax=Sediminibacterium sp. KACHI17 TaxID=1751071 RepID=A0AAT9GJ82_9BACT